MDAQSIAAFLINGGLVSMLKRGKTMPTMAWILRDEAAPFGMRLLFDPGNGSLNGALGGRFIPSYSYINGKLIKPSREEITQFLIDSFGLEPLQAGRVINEAHAERMLGASC